MQVNQQVPQQQTQTQAQKPKQKQKQQPDKNSVQKAIRILSIDGGGIRGVAVARILEEIEKRTGKRIHELFDVIVGTSTGGLLAVMMSVEVPPVPAVTGAPLSCDLEEAKRNRQFEIRIELGTKAGEVLTAKQARELYQLKAKEIFHEDAGFFQRLLERIPYLGKLVHMIPLFFRSKYENGVGLKRIVKELYIKNGFKHAKTCVGVVVTERGIGKALLLESTSAKVRGHVNYHNNLSLTKLVRATSAAPTYFRSVQIHNPYTMAKNKAGVKTYKVGMKEILKMKLTSALWGKRTDNRKFCDREMLFFEDGGVTCNNPSLQGYRYSKNLLKLHHYNPREYQFQIYSLGTGATKFDEPDPAHEIIKKLEKKGGKVQSGLWDSLHRLAFNDPFNIARQSYQNHIDMKEKLVSMEKRTKISQKYFRLQFEVTKEQLGKLDDSSKKHIGNLIAAAEYCIEKNKVFENIIVSLKTPVERPKNLTERKPPLPFIASIQTGLCMMGWVLKRIRNRLDGKKMRLCTMDKALKRIQSQLEGRKMLICTMDKVLREIQFQFESKELEMSFSKMRLSMTDKILDRIQSEVRELSFGG